MGIKDLLMFIESIMRDGGSWIVFITAAVEAFPLIGALIPGHIVIILGGFLAHLGILSLPLTLFLASLGAVLGDLMGYILGKKYGAEWIEKYGRFFYIKEEHIKKSHDMLHKHTGKALIIGRFSPITRALMPFFAGAGDIKPGIFWTYNIIGGTLWAVSSVMIGYLAGASYLFVADYIGRYLFWGIVYIGLIIWAYIFLEKREHIFSRKHLYTLILAVTSLLFYVKILQDAFTDKLSLSNLDVNFNVFINSINTEFLTISAIFFSDLFSPSSILVYSIVTILYWIFKKRHLFVYFYVFAVGGGFMLSPIFKNIVERIRPDNKLLNLTDYSFPSGHALISTVFMGTLAYYVHRSRMNHNVKAILYGLFVIVVFLVSSSRLILSVHWMTDVVGGVILGIFWLSFSVLLFHVLGKQEERWAEEYRKRFPKKAKKSKKN